MGKRALKEEIKALKATVGLLKEENQNLTKEVQCSRMILSKEDYLLGCSLLHNQFLEFMYQANKAKDKILVIADELEQVHLFSRADVFKERYQHMSNFLNSLSNHYSRTTHKEVA